MGETLPDKAGTVNAAGRYRARVASATRTRARTGTAQVAVRFVVTAGDRVGQAFTWYGALTDKARKYTLADLAFLGLAGGDLERLASLAGVETDIGVEPDTYQGRERLKVAWIGAPHDGGAWKAEVATRGVRPVADAFGGFDFTERPASLSPCPACEAEKRHPKRQDKRGAVGLTPDGQGWRCFECAEGGSALDFAAWCSLGKELDRDNEEALAVVRRACAELGLCDPDPLDTRPAPTRAKRLPPPAPKPPQPPKRPPADEVAALWAACVPVLDDPEVAAWLGARGLDAGDVEARDLARALPAAAKVPRWARFNGKAWNKAPQGFRVILPMFDATGRLESLHARALAPQADNGSDKTAAPAGAELRGLLLTDPLARLMLAGDTLGDGSSSAELVARVGLWVAEGDPDFLTLATLWSDADDGAPAVLGVVSGSWREDSADLAAKVPNGCTVTLATHADKDGEKYAAQIVASLAERMKAGQVQVKRKDWNGKAG